MGSTPSFTDSWTFLKEYIKPINFNNLTHLEGKCLTTLCPFVYLCFPVDREGKFCYDGIYSTAVGTSQCFRLPCVLSVGVFLPVLPADLILILWGARCLICIQSYPVRKENFPHAKETNHLHE